MCSVKEQEIEDNKNVKKMYTENYSKPQGKNKV